MASITQRFLVPVSTVSARNAWHNDPLLCLKYNEKRVADYESRCLRKRDLKNCNNLSVNKEKLAYVISYNRHIKLANMPSPYPIRTVQAWWRLGLRAPLVVGRNYSLFKYIFFLTLDRTLGFFTFQTTTSRFVLDNLYSCNQTNNLLDHSQLFNSTWSYENRVSKHFVIFRNFPCLIAWHMFTALFAYVVFFCFACFVAMDLCRSGCRQNYYLTSPPPLPICFPYPQFFL